MLLCYACSTKKNNAVNRFYHSTTAKYNILFNGKVAYKKAMDSLSKHLRVNHREKMPFVFTHQGKLSKKSAFYQYLDFAEEKATKSIQKHSMFIGGEQRNDQIDESYLILGKVRFHTRRLSPALEAFTEITTKDMDANRQPEALIWQAKTQLDLGNLFIANNIVTNFLKNKYKKAHLATAHELMAHINLVKNKKTKALQAIKKAVTLTKNQNPKRKILMGQIYEDMGQIEKAKNIFIAVSKDNSSSYPFDVLALLCWSDMSLNPKEREHCQALLKKYSHQKKYQNYFGDVFLALGNLSASDNDEKNTMRNYSKAAAFSKDTVQKINVMKTLAKYHLKKGNYELTKKYYDSILSFNVLGNAKIKFQKQMLTKVLKIEKRIQKSDSILRLLGFSTAQRTRHYEDIAAKIKSKKATTSSDKKPLDKKNNHWYFSNKNVVAIGKTRFIEQWGNIKLEDNWKWKRNFKSAVAEPSSTEKEQDTIRNWILKKIKTLQTFEKKKDSLISNQLQDKFQIALLYKELFNNWRTSQKYFKWILQEATTPPSLRLGSCYHLYMMSIQINTEEANVYKKQMLSEFPQHFMVQSLFEKNEVSNNFKAIQNGYDEAFMDYKNEAYNTAISKLNLLLVKQKNNLTTKILLLKSMALLKIARHREAEELLEVLKLNYGHQREGAIAQKLLAQIKEKKSTK